jgi:hypothetical protein
MKVTVYQELKFFGVTEKEINSISLAHQSQLRDAGIQLIQKEKDYSKLRLMLKQYMGIDVFLKHMIRKDQERYKDLVEDIDLFMKHYLQLTELDKNLKGRISQVETFYHE